MVISAYGRFGIVYPEPSRGVFLIILVEKENPKKIEFGFYVNGFITRA